MSLRKALIGVSFFFFFLASLVEAGDLPTLKEVPSWRGSPPQYFSYQGGSKAFYVRRIYQRNDGARVEVLLAGGTEGARLAKVLEGRFEIDTKEYKLKYLKEGPYRVLLSFTPAEKSGFWAVFLNDNPVIILFARFFQLEDQEALSFLKKLDWESISKRSKAFFKEGSS